MALGFDGCSGLEKKEGKGKEGRQCSGPKTLWLRTSLRVEVGVALECGLRCVCVHRLGLSTLNLTAHPLPSAKCPLTLLRVHSPQSTVPRRRVRGGPSHSCVCAGPDSSVLNPDDSLIASYSRWRSGGSALAISFNSLRLPVRSTPSMPSSSHSSIHPMHPFTPHTCPQQWCSHHFTTFSHTCGHLIPRYPQAQIHHGPSRLPPVCRSPSHSLWPSYRTVIHFPSANCQRASQPAREPPPQSANSGLNQFLLPYAAKRLQQVARAPQSWHLALPRNQGTTQSELCSRPMP